MIKALQTRKSAVCAACIAILTFSSCSDNNDVKEIAKTPVTVNVTLPSEAQQGTVGNEQFLFTNITTGEQSSYTEASEISLIPGYYDLAYNAELLTTEDVWMSIRGVASGITVGKDPVVIPMDAFCMIENDDLIIAEIFFSGTLQSSGNQYYGDDYIKLYNNSDHTIYADGITIFESDFLTTDKYDYTPDIMAEAVSVDALYTVPGSGKEHPVEPGEYFLIADTGIDHRVSNPNSFDLSHAHFEWYDQSTVPSSLDVDGPVENLDKWYCYTRSFWMLHNRGFKAYGIARIPVAKDDYLAEYRYDFAYVIDTSAGTFPMTGTAYKIPNEWVMDIVNLSIPSGYVWNVSSPKLDMGWTHCGEVDKDKNRFFKSVRRKLLYLRADGKPVFKDTNNSTLDFNADCVPSEIEIQGTAVDINGTKCTKITYDGVTPVK